MKNFFDKPWFYKLLALFFAILLAIYVNNDQKGYAIQGKQNQSAETAKKRETIKVPLQVSVDTDKYYVTGYPEKVSLTISGANSLVTSTMNTQNFRVFIDLTALKTGQHTVPIKVSGLSSQLGYTINPENIQVDIQERKSRSFPVQIEYNKNAAFSGYEFGTATSSPSAVNVTGAKSEINQIDKVVAKAVLPKDETKTFERQVLLVAEDKKGRQLNVVIDPATAYVKIPIKLSEKKVKLSITSKNENQSKIYSLTTNHDYVNLFGKESDLKKIDQISLDVNLEGITTSTIKKIPLKLPNNVVKAEPAEFSVKIKVSDSGK